MIRKRTDNFLTYMNRAGSGREGFWLLRWLRRRERPQARTPQPIDQERRATV